MEVTVCVSSPAPIHPSTRPEERAEPAAPCPDRQPSSIPACIAAIANSPSLGLIWCRRPTFPPHPTTVSSQQASGRGYSEAARRAEHGLTEQPACSRQGLILQHGTAGEVTESVPEPTAFGDADRTKASTYTQPTPEE